MKDKKNLEKIIEIIKGIEIEKLNLVELLNLAEQENDKDLIEDTVLQINDLLKKRKLKCNVFLILKLVLLVHW